MVNKSDEKDTRIRELEKQLKKKEKELQRKDSTLAEVVAILTLKKNWIYVEELWARTNDES